MSFGAHVGESMSLVADDVRSAVIADTGHFLAVAGTLPLRRGPRW